MCALLHFDTDVLTDWRACGATGSVYEALKHWASIRAVDKADELRCGKCHKLASGQAQQLLHTAPNVLLLVLDRFNKK